MRKIAFLAVAGTVCAGAASAASERAYTPPLTPKPAIQRPATTTQSFTVQPGYWTSQPRFSGRSVYTGASPVLTGTESLR